MLCYICICTGSGFAYICIWFCYICTGSAYICTGSAINVYGSGFEYGCYIWEGCYTYGSGFAIYV